MRPLILSLLLVLAARGADKPNFVFILVDDMGWTGLSVAMDDRVAESKSDFYRTPNIARLARQGMRFSNAYAPASLCTPSRAAILTGKSPAQLHMTTPGRPKRAPESWHKVIQPRHIADLPAGEVTIAEALKPLGYATAHLGKWHLNGGGPGEHGFDLHDGDTGNEPPGTSAANPKDIFGITQRAVAFMKANAAKPFYLQLSHYAVHSPIEALATTKAEFTKKAKGRRHNNVDYAAMTHDLDTGVGTVLDAIDALGLGKRTYVVLLSDNGAPLKLNQLENSPLSNGKGSLFEGGIRVPLIIRGPGIKANTTCRTPVVGTDLYATFRELAGVTDPLPKGTESLSLVPLLGGKSIQRDQLVFHYPHYGRGPRQTPQSAIRVGNDKLIKFWETGEVRLFDLSSDIAEKVNLAERYPEKTSQLTKHLAGYLADIHAQLPTPNPDYDPNAKPSAPGRKSGGGFAGRFDKNGDGKISKSEFTGPPRRFNLLDKNHDGQLTGDEIPTGPPPARRHQ